MLSKRILDRTANITMLNILQNFTSSMYTSSLTADGPSYNTIITEAITTESIVTGTSITTMYTTTNSTNNTTTTPGCETEAPLYVGFIAAAVSILFFGTNFAPVKKFDTGDGMFFQWVLCISIWFCGLVVHVIRGSPKFYPMVMLGGFLWETGNVCVVPIIKTIGLGLGMCIWGMTNLLSGWATGRFGLFGTKADPPDHLALNDIGVCMAVLSAVIFAMVKNDVGMDSVDHTITIDVDETSPLLSNALQQHNREPTYIPVADNSHEEIVFGKHRQSRINESAVMTSDNNNKTVFDNISPPAKRILGIGLSLVSGIFYGQLFTPAIYVQDNYTGASQQGVDYAFSTFSGILATSTVYFLIYSAISKNQPKVYPRAILPGFISGVMWGIACSSWFIANKIISESVSFPIISTGPGVVATLVSVFIFKEIKGRKNILILAIGMTVTIIGSVLCGFSKNSKPCK